MTMITALRHQLPDDHARVVAVLTTWPADRDPFSFVETLVEERLVACVNVSPPVESVYRWDGAMHRDGERQLFIKTTAARIEALRVRVGELHPYDVPEFLVLPVEAGATNYLDWVQESTSPGPSGVHRPPSVGP